MTRTEIEEYLINLEHRLLIEAKQHSIELNREWPKQFPNAAGIYVFRDKGEICYIGETGQLRGRMTDILDTRNHTLRRNLGNKLFADSPDFSKASSSKTFSPQIEKLLNNYITTNLTVSLLPVELGRKELEERLYDKFVPQHNQKGRRGGTKAYSKEEKQRTHKNAYEPWTKHDDEQLEILFCKGISTKELSQKFGRNEGAIRSRIDKLELREKYGS